MIATDSLGAPPALGLRRVACAALARAGTLLRAASTGASTDVLPEVVGEARLARAAWRLGRSTDGARLVGDADRALAELHARLPTGSSADRVVAAREATRSAGLPAPSEALEAWLAVAGSVRRRAAVRPDRAPLEELVRDADAAREVLVAAPWAPDEGSAVAASLARATGEVRGAMVRVRHGACWRLHACRGPLDELRHALRALGHAAASAGRRDALGAPARDVEGLAALAGRDHDQALLRATLSRVDLPAALAPEAARLRAAVDADRDRAESLARPLLARLFGEPGGALGRAVILGVREKGAAPARPSGSSHRRPAGSVR
jgi:hypothetical protein